MKKILFIRQRLDTIGGTGVFTVLLMNELVKSGYIIGLYAQNQNEFKLQKINKRIKILNTELYYNEVDWDIVIIQNILSFEYAKSLLMSINVPIIFISHSSSPIDQPILYEKIRLVLKIAEGIDGEKWGIPKEFTEIFRNPVEMVTENINKDIKSKQIKLLTVSRLGLDKMDLLRKLIFIVNQLPNLYLTIVGGGPTVSFKLLKSISNENIIFTGEQINIQKYYAKCDIVVGSGRVAVEAMANKKPFILWGINGYEGYVTKSNYQELKKIMFSGNRGNKKKHNVSVKEFENEIRKIVLSDSYTSDIENNYNNVKDDFSVLMVTSQFKRIIENVLEVAMEINHDDLFLKLKPKIVSCVGIVKTSNNEYQFINRDTNCLLEVIPKELSGIEKYLNGKKTNFEIVSLFANNLACKKFIKRLFSRKIIFFEKNN